MGETKSGTHAGYRKCARCGQDFGRLTVLGVDLSQRVVFAFSVAVLLLGLDILLYRGRPEGLSGFQQLIAWTFGARFVFACFCVYPFFVHYVHKRCGDTWWEHLPLGVMIPMLIGMDFLVRLVGEALGLLGPYGTSLR